VLRHSCRRGGSVAIHPSAFFSRSYKIMSLQEKLPALTLTSLPAAVSARIMKQLPLADRVRCGGVSPAWRAVAHAPSLYGPELVLSEALDARPCLRADEDCLRSSAVFVLRALAALAAGTLTALDATPNNGMIPDSVWSEALVSICAANPSLVRVTTNSPRTLKGALQLLRRCPRVRTLALARLETAITADTLAALTPEERATSVRLALNALDLAHIWCRGPSIYDYRPAEPDYLGVLTSAQARASLPALRESLAAIGAGAWVVGELRLPACKNDGAVLVEMLTALTTTAAASAEAEAQQQPGAGGACRLNMLALHYSFKERELTPMTAATARAITATMEALPSLWILHFCEERDPELAALERDANGEGESYDPPPLSSYIFAGKSEEDYTAYGELKAAVARRKATMRVTDAVRRY